MFEDDDDDERQQDGIGKLVQDLSNVLNNHDMRTSAIALAICISFVIDHAGASTEEKKEARKYINNVIDKTLKGADIGRSSWGKLFKKLMDMA